MEQGKFQIIFRRLRRLAVGLFQSFCSSTASSRAESTSGLFQLAPYDAAAEEFLRSDTAPAQIAAARTMSDLARTYMPMLPAIFRLENDFVQPWLKGFSPQIFTTYWKYLDIDLDRRK